MKPVVVDLRGTLPDAAALAPAVEHVAAGGLLVYPTETVYGIGGGATPGAVAALTRLKRRPPDRPFLLLVGSPDDVADLAWTPVARELADLFWPGSLTLVLSDPRGIFPQGVRSPDGAVAVRVSPHPVVRVLLAGLDGPLTSTSANLPGQAPAATGEGAREVARRLAAGPELMVVDGGALPASASSTIVDCTGPSPVVLREGTVPIGRLRCVLPDIHGRDPT